MVSNKAPVTNKKQSTFVDAVKTLWLAGEPILKIVLPILILSLGVGFVLYYIIELSPYYITSDSTDSMRWAQASLESGKLIGDNFNYAAILPFGGNLIFLPLIALFGYSMTAQLVGMTVFALLLAAALYYMATGIGLNRYWSAGLVSAVFILLSSSAKLREIMWEHIFYYNLGILFFCLGVGLVSRLLREKNSIISPEDTKHGLINWGLFAVVAFVLLQAASWSLTSYKKLFLISGVLIAGAVIFLVLSSVLRKNLRVALDWTRLGFLAVFSLLAATNGLQTLVCFALPVFGGIVIERLFDGDTPLFSKKNLRVGGILITLIIATGVGYKLIEKASGGVTAGYMDAYSTYSGMGSWVNNFLGFFNNWFTLNGVGVADGDDLVTRESIINIIRIFGSLLLLIIPVIFTFFWKKINSRGIKIALVAHFAVSAFILFAVTFGSLGGANWRLTPMLGTSVILCFVAAAELIRQKKLAARFGALVLAVLFVLALPTVLEIKDKPKDTGDNIAWHLATETLVSHDLKYGYASFWFAETVSLLSDGELEVANIRENTDKPSKYPYQVSKDAFDDKADAESYFLLLTEKENETMSYWLEEQDADGCITDYFEILTPGYNLRGHKGTYFFVYIFDGNIF